MEEKNIIGEIDLIVQKIKSKDKKNILDKLSQELAKIDQDLLKNKPAHLCVKDIRHRWIWTPKTGKIKIVRRRYFNNNTKKYHYLLDEKLNLSKRKYISDDYQKLAYLSLDKHYSYQKIADLIFDKAITQMSVYNFIKNYKATQKDQKNKKN